jgi:acetyltransferase
MTAATQDRTERPHDEVRSAAGHPLDALLAPKSVALIGASGKPGSVGRALLENLRSFGEAMFAVNPNHREILGVQTLPDIASIGQTVDLAVIATPASTVPGIIRDCTAKGVRAAIVVSAGFRETGRTGAEQEQRILAEARRGKLRVLGPNCLGLMVPRLRLNATFAEGLAKPGGVAFLSQSGALCSAVLDWSFRENVGFSTFVSVGSMLDVGWGDLISRLGDDPHTESIVCYMESVGDARRFLSAARQVAPTKPIIVLKVGHTEAAAKAAASHTGALTGSDAVLDAAFRRAGVLRVDTIAELFNMTELLSKQPRPHGPRLTIVTNAGGPGALATDTLVANGAQLAPLSAHTLAALNALLPSHWSHGNPVDLLGDANAARYARAVELVSDDENTDGVLVILTPQAMTEAGATAGALKQCVRPDGKPILASWMGGAAVDAGKETLNAAGVPTFDHPDAAARAFALMWRHSDALRLLHETPVSLPSSETGQATRDAAEHELQLVRGSGRTLLTEVESKRLLGIYGIPSTPTRAAFTEDEAVQAAEELGFPVALKLLSETLTHKSDVGGVELDIREATNVRQAWQRIRTAVDARAGLHHFLGVTVQPMIRRDGYELILGSSIDPQFGPVLLFGTGGKLVEVFKDTAVGLPPLNATLARRLMERTRVFTALQGVRGSPAVDLAALTDLLIRFSHLVVEQPWIAEIDINPLLVSSEQLLALDARVVLHPPDTREASLPRPAIRPYPGRYVLPFRLEDGTEATLRPVRPEDEPLMAAFHRNLSEHSFYQSCFNPLKLEQGATHGSIGRLCFIDYDREMALVVERRHPRTHQPEILAVGCLNRIDGTHQAEFGLTVADAWQFQGLGFRILRALVRVGHDEKLHRITATILADNRVMEHVARKAGFTLSQDPQTNEYRAEILP